jgi:hypothetical protein
MFDIDPIRKQAKETDLNAILIRDQYDINQINKHAPPQIKNPKCTH